MATVLIVDDDPHTRRLVVAALAGRGHRVLEAGDGDAGLALIRDERPDVVLLDVQLPGLDGAEVCRRVKADPALGGTRVVVLTADSPTAAQRLADAAGADASLTKPFSPAHLLDLVERQAG